jgi:hypothetical protein
MSAQKLRRRSVAPSHCVTFWPLRGASYTASGVMILKPPASSFALCRERVVRVDRQKTPPVCVLANRTNIRVSTVLALHLGAGDEIAFPIPTGNEIDGEVYVSRGAVSPERHHDIYQVSLGYVTQPKMDKRGQHFVSAEVRQSGFGISAIFLPCGALREYFYRLQVAGANPPQQNYYEKLRIPPSASPAELRLAYRLCTLELGTDSPREWLALERSFNILGQPELRACYDALLADPEAPAIFPYGGFGSLLVSGERSRDGQTFFADRILAFSPERSRRRFNMPLRQCDFYEDRAMCHDVRRKLEFWLDPALLHTLWDPTWNQWKHLLGTKIEVDGTFIQSGKYRKRRAAWELVRWETALPSRLAVQLPADFQQQVERAKAAHHRFGQYSRALDQIRLCLEHRAIDRAELERMCSILGIPSDFDIAQISWRPDYDPFFYDQLSDRAGRIYLFRGEYIFDLERAVVVETPQLGHATYVFAKPRSMESFLLCTQKSPRRISGAIGITSANAWAFWGASSTASTRGLGSKRCDSAWGKRWTLLLRWSSAPHSAGAVRQNAIGESFALVSLPLHPSKQQIVIPAMLGPSDHVQKSLKRIDERF